MGLEIEPTGNTPSFYARYWAQEEEERSTPKNERILFENVSEDLQDPIYSEAADALLEEILKNKPEFLSGVNNSKEQLSVLLIIVQAIIQENSFFKFEGDTFSALPSRQGGLDLRLNDNLLHPLRRKLGDLSANDLFSTPKNKRVAMCEEICNVIESLINAFNKRNPGHPLKSWREYSGIGTSSYKTHVEPIVQLCDGRTFRLALTDPGNLKIEEITTKTIDPRASEYESIRVHHYNDGVIALNGAIYEQDNKTLSEEKTKDAIRSLTVAYSMNKKDPLVLENLWLAFSLSQGDNKKAMENIFSESLALGNTNIWFHKGNKYLEENNLDDAKKAFQRVAPDNNNYCDTQDIRAYILLKENKPEEAMKLCFTTLEKDPNHHKTLYYLGMAFFNLKRYERAETAFNLYVKQGCREETPGDLYYSSIKHLSAIKQLHPD